MITATRRLSVGLVLVSLAPSVSAAQSSCGSRSASAGSDVAGASWPTPLDRVISFQAYDISLRDALGRLAAAARVRLSYSSELLPLGRRVCVSHTGAPVGVVLSELLLGTTLEPRAVGSDHVALAPMTMPARTAPLSDTARSMDRMPTVLERVVVTGTMVGGPQRSLPVAVDAVSGAQLERYATDGMLSHVLGSAVPGIWIWDQSPSSLVARYGSIRGASSFGASYPKVYIDGIEVANPLLVTHVSPDMVERIEVIRGPQGAALYGADAISGVINIVTRTDGVASGAPRLLLRSDAGVAQSDFTSLTPLAQHHALTLRTGSGFRSAGLGVTVSTVGAFVPDAYSRQLTATGSARFVRSRSVVTATARFVAQSAASSVSPLINGSVRESPNTGPGAPPSPMLSTDPQSARQYTLGANARFMGSSRWTHAVVVGLDGYSLANVPDDVRSVPLPDDASLQAARGAADRGTLRASSVASFGDDDRVSTALNFAVEHSMLRERSDARASYGRLRGRNDGLRRGAEGYTTSWRTNTGVVTQTKIALRQALYLTGGVRVERNAGFVADDHVTVLPMLGAVFVRDRGDLTVKLRGAYGKGIRPHRIAAHETPWAGMRGQVLAANLAPEQQSGIEAGLDLVVGRTLTLRATRFDQLASDLIQRVTAGADAEPTGEPGPRHVRYMLQNVGQITNRGWELDASAEIGPLSLSAALSLVDSRVRRLAVGYTGDLRPGDRMLEVPARTVSVTASWARAGWFGSLTAARASDWINYDRLALTRAVANGEGPTSPEAAGAWFRSFWRPYDGVTRLRLTTSRELRRGVALVLTGENLLDRQLGEPDNVTILPGRTITAGIKASF